MKIFIEDKVLFIETENSCFGFTPLDCPVEEALSIVENLSKEDTEKMIKWLKSHCSVVYAPVSLVESLITFPHSGKGYAYFDGQSWIPVVSYTNKRELYPAFCGDVCLGVDLGNNSTILIYESSDFFVVPTNWVIEARKSLSVPDVLDRINMKRGKKRKFFKFLRRISEEYEPSRNVLYPSVQLFNYINRKIAELRIYDKIEDIEVKDENLFIIHYLYGEKEEKSFEEKSKYENFVRLLSVVFPYLEQFSSDNKRIIVCSTSPFEAKSSEIVSVKKLATSSAEPIGYVDERKEN